MQSRITVLIVDDHPMFRNGVVQSLRLDRNIEVVGECSDGNEAIGLAASLRPDIILLDISMPGNGIDAAARIAELDHAPKVIMLTVSEQDDDVIRALDAGAVGYVLKGVSASELISVLRCVAAGDSFVSPNLTLRILNHARKTSEPSLASLLSDRELRIAKLIGKGLSNREIADQLTVKEKTITFHMTNIMKKLNVRNRVETALLVRKAMDRAG
ncbi:response regulator [Hoeflea ulvae]|uniref:Response regulator transcription factor n=1 Tax=Hoeflea ulvae TaxID=2983764 RepID=A0ABT3YM46_9HYPH|nr:response regulator transcription factor [Hoeflea ulvae]MCY0096970.1 response regulator transcription factor [Hoeflea ulvae]